jgi:hypothetical protein
MSEEQCQKTLAELLEKYKDNEYMMQRLVNHITTILPNTLDTESANYEKRVVRQNFLSNEQQSFIQVFLNKNRYFYMNNNFYEYDGKHYMIVKEDDIIHNLLSSISKDRTLLEWKYKTKISVVKLIRERSLFSSIPESYTIQSVLGLLYPQFFQSKNQAKHFLTIIGDNILTKHDDNLIFLIGQHMKRMLNELDTIAYASIGHASITPNFLTKYHENHSYANCRLIKMNENCSFDAWKNIVRNNGLDIFCVAVHYSNRYGDSDKFIDNNSDDEFRNYVYYLKNMTQEEIVAQFCSNYIDEVQDVKFGWKDLHFVWKQFLSSLSLPNMIYSNTLKNLFKQRYEFDETCDSFVGVTSRYLPLHSDFINFWTTTINTDTSTENILELEIDELCSLFKSWAKQNATKQNATKQNAAKQNAAKQNVTKQNAATNGNISEDNVIKILKHFFPTTEITEDKYVLNTECILWDKNKEIVESFDYIKEHIKAGSLTLISFDDAYNYYSKYCNVKSHKFVVSKRYFEKYICFHLSNHIVYEKFIETEWILK